MGRRYLNPVLPGGLLSPLSGADELTSEEEIMIGHLQAGDAQSETPSGALDDSNTVFTLSRSPSPAKSLLFYINGQLMKEGAGNDYVLSGNTITTDTPPDSSSNLLANYLVDTDT